MKRNCIQCDEPLYGRSDQRFCSTSCHSHYHNHKREGENKTFYATHKHLITNYKMLSKILEQHPHIASINQLSRFGFVASKITEIELEGPNTRPVFYLYDIGFRYLDQKHIEVFKCPIHRSWHSNRQLRPDWFDSLQKVPR